MKRFRPKKAARANREQSTSDIDRALQQALASAETRDAEFERHAALGRICSESLTSEKVRELLEHPDEIVRTAAMAIASGMTDLHERFDRGETVPCVVCGRPCQREDGGRAVMQINAIHSDGNVTLHGEEFISGAPIVGVEVSRHMFCGGCWLQRANRAPGVGQA